MIEEVEMASPSQVDTFAHIVASRGKMLRPYAAMLHVPALARAAADLGAVIRYQGTMPDGDRELVIVTTAVERGCAFEIAAHSPLALSAGVSQETLDSVLRSAPVDDASDAELVDFVRELCRSDKVSDAVFERSRARLGDEGVVELAATIGYYSMIALFMNACEVC
jgi:4-carboxymuconolactone decarboxylase